jgi:hypothetical protein
MLYCSTVYFMMRDMACRLIIISYILYPWLLSSSCHRAEEILGLGLKECKGMLQYSFAGVRHSLYLYIHSFSMMEWGCLYILTYGLPICHERQIDILRKEVSEFNILLPNTYLQIYHNHKCIYHIEYVRSWKTVIRNRWSQKCDLQLI